MQSQPLVDYKLSLIAAVVILLIGSIAAITILSIMGGSGTSVTLIIGLITPSIVALLGLIRGETTAKDVGVVNEQVAAVKEQVNGHLAQHTEELAPAIAEIAANQTEQIAPAIADIQQKVNGG